MLEVHPDPDRALSDGPQALLPDMFRDLMLDLARMAPLLGRTLELSERHDGSRSRA